MASKNLKPNRNIQEMSLGAFENKYCFNFERQTLFKGLTKMIKNLKSAGVTEIYITGSFVGDKESPNDIDGCWQYTTSVDWQKIDPVLVDMGRRRQKMKDKYGVDFFPDFVTEGASGKPILKFFETDRDGNNKKIIKIKLK